MSTEKIERKIKNIILWLKPEAGAFLGARWLLMVLAALGTGLFIAKQNVGLGFWVEFGIGFAISLLLLGGTIFALQLMIGWLGDIPHQVLATILLVYILLSRLFGFSSQTEWPLILIIIFTVVFIGGGIGALILDTITRGQRLWLILMLVLVVAGNIGFSAWLLQPKEDPLAWVETSTSIDALDMPDPALSGAYDVKTLTYGSGTDRWRPEYAADADILTDSVNARNYVAFESWVQKTREWYWGFDRSDFPLNGRVWYPDGEGPFPLVLIVHGNHAMTDFSDEGYAYLGELLASRGFIVVSVDQNYLNGYFTGRVSGEDDARAWLLLQHVALWEEWRVDNESPFYAIVDTTNIALIGHSRGGEAVALAAAFNQLARNPSNATISWHFNFDIRTVIAIAPIDGYHRPGGKETPLQDINYLVIQGAQDSDINSFVGLRQYNRISFSPNSKAFKAAVYIHRANHGQFNTSWGSYDRGWPYAWFLNTSTLLDGEDQRQIAKVYISAFLETTLQGKTGYIPFFQNHHTGESWLPEALLINQYSDATDVHLVTFEEDIDVKTGSYPGVEVKGLGLSHWREIELSLRKGKKQDDHAVSLNWNNFRDQFQITLPAGLVEDLALDETSLLRFDIGDARNEDDVDTLLDLTICLEDTHAQQACVLLSDYAQLLPQFRAQFTTWPLWEKNSFKDASESILQSYSIPLSDLLMQNPQFNLARMHRINFVFDQIRSGTIYLDDIGFGE